MAVINPGYPYNAGLDANNIPTLTAVSGTAGTADTTGTAEIFALGGNPANGALYVSNLGPAVSTFGTSGTASAGTLVAAPGAGTSIYVSAVSISAVSGTSEVVVSFGTALNGGLVLERGLFIAGGGIQASYLAETTGTITNSPLTWNIISGSGTVAFAVKYRVGV